MQSEQSMTGTPVRFYHPSSRLRKALPYFIRNGPLAIVSSSLPGFVNYVAILYVSYAVNLEAAGMYRLLMSYFTLCGLPTLQQASRVYIRASASGNREQITAIFMAQVYVCVLLAAALAASYVIFSGLDLHWLPPAVLPIALGSMLLYPCELFIAHLQARQQFFRLFLLTTVKWLSTLAVFIIAFHFTRDVTFAFMLQLAAMVAIDIAIYAGVAGRSLLFEPALFNPFRLVRRPEVREGAVLSASQILPGAIEQVDKLLVGAIFGLKALGLYTVGFSTGRLLYNMLKPSLYIYYRHFVDAMPPKRLLRLLFVTFTALGAVVSVGYWLAINFIPALARFQGTEPVATVLFLSYGISIVDAVYSQAYAINKDTNSVHLFIGNTASSLLCLLIFLVAAFLPVSIGLVVFASFYPVRHGAAVAITAWQRRRAERRLAPDPTTIS